MIKGSLDEKLPSYELLNMLQVIDSYCNRFVMYAIRKVIDS